MPTGKKEKAKSSKPLDSQRTTDKHQFLSGWFDGALQFPMQCGGLEFQGLRLRLQGFRSYILGSI